MSVQNLKIRLHILSPVHIGCDDVYEPTNFVIDEQNKKLIEFDPMDFIKALSLKERDEFLRKCSGDNLLDIFKFIKRAYKPSVKGKELEIAQGLIEHYKKVLTMSIFNKKAVINQFTISKTAYNPQTNLPYIPGTSLKGSMRTAYLSALAGSGNYESLNAYLESKTPLQGAVKDFKGKAKELEIRLLNGEFSSDPFRLVKVSDLMPVDEAKTKVFYAVNKKKKPNDTESKAAGGDVYQIFESVQRGCIFEGSVSILSPEPVKEIKTPINTDSLLRAVHKHYARIFIKEKDEIAKAVGFAMPGLLTSSHGKLKEKAFLIRLGRHSGAEAVTIEGNRSIKIKGKDNDFTYKDHATTLWLASETSKPKSNIGLLPFGWAVLEVVQ